MGGGAQGWFLVVKDTKWSPGLPGHGAVELDGTMWDLWDYKEEIPVTEEMAALLGVLEGGAERRQCVSLTMGAALAWRATGRRPTLEEARHAAQTIRLEQLRQVVDAKVTFDGGASGHDQVSAVEHEIMVFMHDILTRHHEKDFRSLAVFPLAAFQDARILVLRADYRAGLVVEAIVGERWHPESWTACCLI